MKITVIGTGYVGLVTGTCFAELGNDVLCFDLDQDKVAALKSGHVTIHEPGLPEMVRRCVAAGRLRFSSDIEESVAFGQSQFIAVGTPSKANGSTDLQYVLLAARNIGKHMTDYRLIVNKSTVPIGATAVVSVAVAEELEKRGLNIPYSVVSNPEFLREGSAVADFMRPDRIVIGAEDDHAISLMREIYAEFGRNHDRMIVMDPRSAELTKYAANCVLATRISLMNELANLADRVGADIERVRIGIGSDSRIGYGYLYAGCGYGGSCLPKDVRALINFADSVGQPVKVLRAVDEVNDSQKLVLLEKIRSRFGADLRGRHFALWGLAFKPDTDDIREAPSLAIVCGLRDMGATIAVYDPVAIPEFRRILGTVQNTTYADSPMGALVGADALVIVTEWKELRMPDFEHIKGVLKNPVIFDGRNIYNPAYVRAAGLEYHTIGRSASSL